MDMQERERVTEREREREGKREGEGPTVVVCGEEAESRPPLFSLSLSLSGEKAADVAEAEKGREEQRPWVRGERARKERVAAAVVCGEEGRRQLRFSAALFG